MAPLVEKNTAPIAVERLCAEVTRALPADGILVADTGYSGIWTGTMIDLNGAGQTYQRAAGSLGWSFPASLGATCAAGARKVVCFTGDGGFYYHLAELETARRCNIPVTVIVNNNSGFGQNLTGVRRISGNRPGRGEELIRFVEANASMPVLIGGMLVFSGLGSLASETILARARAVRRDAGDRVGKLRRRTASVAAAPSGRGAHGRPPLLCGAAA